MATIPVQRPKLSPAERAYLPALRQGLAITFGHLKRAITGKTAGRDSLAAGDMGVTMQYPEEKWDDHLPEYYRGVPALVEDEQGRERCVSCQLCEFICPPRAITITPSEIPADDPWAKVEKRPQEFEIDMTRCIYCGMCEEVCPEQAIYLQKDYVVTGTSRAEMIHDKAKLYQIGGLRRGLVNKWNEEK